MVISSFELTNSIINTPLLIFYFELGLVCTKVHRLLENTPVISFNKFVESAVNAHCQGDKNPNTSVVEKTLKLLANSSYGYPFMNRSRHSAKECMKNEKTLAAINNKMFKRKRHFNDEFYDVGLAKPEIENEEPIIVVFFILQYAQLRLIELYYKLL